MAFIQCVHLGSLLNQWCTTVTRLIGKLEVARYSFVITNLSTCQRHLYFLLVNNTWLDVQPYFVSSGQMDGSCGGRCLFLVKSAEKVACTAKVMLSLSMADEFCFLVKSSGILLIYGCTTNIIGVRHDILRRLVWRPFMNAIPIKPRKVTFDVSNVPRHWNGADPMRASASVYGSAPMSEAA
jgi:hypothetical protein